MNTPSGALASSAPADVVFRVELFEEAELRLAGLVEEAQAPRFLRQQDVAGAQALGVVGTQPAQQRAAAVRQAELAGGGRCGWSEEPEHELSLAPAGWHTARGS